MRGINKRFDAVVALKDASLQVQPGEIMALLGSNGSGKSTMIKVLAGLVNPNSGEVLIDGKPVSIHSGKNSRDLKIATAYQDLSSVPTMTVMDNIMLGMEKARPFGMINKREALREVNALLARFKLDCHPDDFVQTLMPSTQSMLEVAKAVYQKPRLLLLDEVTASLHHDEIETLFSVIKELQAEGTAIIYVTHRMKEIFQICNKATIMRSGETAAADSLSNLTLDDIVFYMTGQRPDVKVTDTSEACVQNYKEHDKILEAQDIEIEPKVKNISLDAYKGQIVGIGGLEGQGQPEFIRSVLGVLQPGKGNFKYLGKPVKFRSAYYAIKNDIGFVSGERGREAIFAARTVEENICAGYFARGHLFSFLHPKKVHAYANEAVKTYSIKIGSLAHPASSLSGGNQQKLVVARWLSLNPKLLLLDDPTKGVDVHSRNEIHRILKACADKGMTVIIVSSDNEELLDVADCIYVFYEGRVSAVLSGAEKTAEKLVAGMMGMTGEHAQGGEAQ